MGKLYQGLKWILCNLRRRKTTLWAEPFVDEPCIFIANHDGAWGPIEMVSQFELSGNVAVWCQDSVMHRETCVDYVRHDYWWSEKDPLRGLYNVTIPYVASWLMPPVMRSAPTIPVFHDERVMTTFRLSIKALKEGKYIVIFPEIPDGHLSHKEEIATGWMSLCRLYHRSTGKEIRMYPVHIDRKNRLFHVGKPVQYDASIPMEQQQERLGRILAAGLRGQKIEY